VLSFFKKERLCSFVLIEIKVPLVAGRGGRRSVSEEVGGDFRWPPASR
jgi:hypothetical protein